jgi:hypothetical protein
MLLALPLIIATFTPSVILIGQVMDQNISTQIPI